MESESERRKADRKDVRWPLSVIVGNGRIPGETLNISERGLAICCDEPVPMDEPLKIQIMPPDHQLIHLTGQISWSDLSGIDTENRVVGMGLCILEISDRDRAFFVQMIEKNVD